MPDGDGESLFHWPTREQQLTIVGQNGSGKTRFGAWALANASIDERPWIVIDFKGEPLFRAIGRDRITPISPTDRAPRSPGLYLLHPRLDEKDEVEGFLWRCWEASRRQLASGRPRGIGIFADEGLMMPKDKEGAFDTILVQGRSLRMPRILLVQRPVGVSRYVFSEANYHCLFRLTDRRDRKTVEEWIPDQWANYPRAPYHALWYDTKAERPLILTPCPPDDQIVATIRRRVARPWYRS